MDQQATVQVAGRRCQSFLPVQLPSGAISGSGDRRYQLRNRWAYRNMAASHLIG